MRWANVRIVVVLAIAACSSGDGGSEIAQTPANIETAPTAETPPAAATAETATRPDAAPVDRGPIMFVVTAHDVDQEGVPVDLALEFAADDPQISVVVLIGDVEPGARLGVGWTWLDGPDGEQPLFEHELDVDGGDVAFSHGIATGPLAAGRYRASVSVGGSTTDALFAVRATPITFPEVRSGFARQQQPAEPAPPASGPSGTVPAPSENAPGAVCQPWVQISSLLAMTGATGCGDAVGDDDNLLEVTAWVGGNSPFGLGQARGDFIKPVRPDPCDLGGSDLETEPVSYAVTVISGPDEGKLFRKQGPAPEPDTHAPFGFLDSEPSSGGQVSEGDRIAIEITADDRSSVDSVVTGIASVVLTTNTGQEVGREVFEGPVACDKDRLRRVVRLEYLVPANPPELVQLVATVRDYQGHETTLQATYPTVGLWTGYMDVIGGLSQETSVGSYRCTTPWEFRVVVFAPSSGEIYGYAEGVPGPQTCTDPPQSQGQFTRLGITGTMTTDLITLRFEHKLGGWNGISVLYLPPTSDVTLTRLGNLAYGDIGITQVFGSQTQDLTGRIDLGCDEC